MDIKDGLLGKVPFVTLLVAIAMTATFAASLLGGGDAGGRFDELVVRAQVFYERNPGVELGARSRSLFDSAFIEQVDAAHAGGHGKPAFSARMRARTQQKFDALVDEALEARMVEDPAWSEGITGSDVPPSRYLTYAFFHTSLLAFGVTLLFLLVAGLGLETSWGALVQLPIALVSIVAGGLVFAHVDAAGQLPLTGGGPLVAALLAAYVVRGFGGNLPLPGLLLLPTWLFVDALFVRGIWIDNLGDWPIATLGGTMLIGALVAGTVRALGIDAKLVDTVDRMADGQHPALEAAERFRNLGRTADAYEALTAAAAEEPNNTALVLALWESAIEVGRPEEVAHAILPILQAELRAGDIEAATTHWRQVMASGAPLQVNTTLLVRMGEALLDAGEPEQALDSLRRAVESDGPLGSALAQRIVRIARDLDPVLTARAAELALRDPQLPADARADLQSLAGGAPASTRREASPGAAPAPPAPGAVAPSTPPSLDDIDADLGEPDPAGPPTAAPAVAQPAQDRAADLGSLDGLDDLEGLGDLDDGEIDLSHVGDLASPEDFADLDSGAAGLPPMETGSPEHETDPNALSLQSLEREFAGGLDDSTPGGVGGSRADASGRVEDVSTELDAAGPSLMGEGDLDRPVAGGADLDPGAFGADALMGEPADLGSDAFGGVSDLTADALSADIDADTDPLASAHDPSSYGAIDPSAASQELPPGPAGSADLSSYGAIDPSAAAQELSPGPAGSADVSSYGAIDPSAAAQEPTPGSALDHDLSSYGAIDPSAPVSDATPGGDRAGFGSAADDLSGFAAGDLPDDLAGIGTAAPVAPAEAGVGRAPSTLGNDATDPLDLPDSVVAADPTGPVHALGEPQSNVEPLAPVEPETPPTEALAPVEPETPPTEALAPVEPETPPTEPLLDRGLMDARVERDRATEAPPAAPPADAGRATAVEGLAPMETGGASLRALKVLEAAPIALEADAIKVDVDGRGKTRLPFAKIDAVAVAAVSGLSAKPVLVIDFVMNWNGGSNDPLKVVRVRSDGFNPVALVGATGSPLESIKTLIRRVIDGARATPLPDVGAVMGAPFSTQPDLVTYEREILHAG